MPSHYLTRLFKFIATCTLLLTFSSQAEIAPDENQLTPLLNGHTIPGVTLKDLNNQGIDLNQLTREKPTVFFFYRGGWCPFCNNQMGQLKTIEQKLIDMGFQLVGISPDTPEQLKLSANQNDLSYRLLSDAKLDAAQAFGIAYYTSARTTERYSQKLGVNNPLWTTPSGDKRIVLPVPAVYMSDNKGLIHFQYLNPNFRVRPAPELILTAAKLIADKAL